MLLRLEHGDRVSANGVRWSGFGGTVRHVAAGGDGMDGEAVWLIVFY